MYIPEDAIDESIVAVDAGYSGSSKDHYYCSLGNTEVVSRLERQERACGCQPCLKLKQGCTLTPVNTDLMAGTTARATTVVLHSARPVPAARHTRNARNPLPEFCEGLCVGKKHRCSGI